MCYGAFHQLVAHHLQAQTTGCYIHVFEYICKYVYIGIYMCIAVCCSAVRCGAVCCSMLQYVTMCYGAFHQLVAHHLQAQTMGRYIHVCVYISIDMCIAVRCSALRCGAVRCIMLQYVTVCCGVLHQRVAPHLQAQATRRYIHVLVYICK